MNRKIFLIIFLLIVCLNLYPQELNFIPPIKDYSISSLFGLREDLFSGGQTDYNFHKGIDLVGIPNAEIIASERGVVTQHWVPPNGYYKGHPIYGGMIVIEHTTGVSTLYGHLKRTFVREGQIVEKGEVIGIQGNTGQSTGDHLHFEILFDPYYAFLNSNKNSAFYNVIR